MTMTEVEPGQVVTVPAGGTVVPAPPPTAVDRLAALRAPFPASVIGKLPRVTCKDCSDRSKTCTRHERAKCNVCGGFLSTAHIHLDYVGHAEVTDRLLSVDPLWTWEPVAFDEKGLPAVAKGVGGEMVLWIRLTVCGVTRLGCGSVAAGAFDAEKQLIGDALRNAAMRFGVALDLWAKDDLESTLNPLHPERTQPPAEQTDDAPDWFKANGWTDQAEHDAAVSALVEQVKNDLNDEARAAMKAWMADAGLSLAHAVSRAELDTMKSQADDLMPF